MRTTNSRPIRTDAVSRHVNPVLDTKAVAKKRATIPQEVDTVTRHSPPHSRPHPESDAPAANPRAPPPCLHQKEALTLVGMGRAGQAGGLEALSHKVLLVLPADLSAPALTAITCTPPYSQRSPLLYLHACLPARPPPPPLPSRGEWPGQQLQPCAVCAMCVAAVPLAYSSR